MSTLQVYLYNTNPYTGLMHSSVLGKLPVSFPQDVGTTPVFYNYIKSGRPVDPGEILPNGTLIFGHQVSVSVAIFALVTDLNYFVEYVLNTPVPIWSFGHGLSYTTFN